MWQVEKVGHATAKDRVHSSCAAPGQHERQPQPKGPMGGQNVEPTISRQHYCFSCPSQGPLTSTTTLPSPWARARKSAPLLYTRMKPSFSSQQLRLHDNTNPSPKWPQVEEKTSNLKSAKCESISPRPPQLPLKLRREKAEVNDAK